ncbi:hypothetical protein [Nocardioides jishulii]|uniref:Uncharacterized protein n=1 Tax=Nocardioides jishulii TaxID=2575440 RepID=A0A4U2YTV2_9ACTN|nr:hypothetical protein [Nocardioides jishulii]QCX28789.1 hypothetical protein FCL41_15575 [Nocardioides jishulii]TKI64315.1 hypothetical protein FC770_03995 [Nocardioides jishulii]
MSATPPERVRVTGPPRRAAQTRRPGTGDIDEGTRIGAILIGSLVGEQRRLAVRVLIVLGAVLGSLPLVFRLLPALADVRWFGIPLAYLLLWVLVHPLLLGLGWFYVRRAEANERAFSALVGHDDPDDEPDDDPRAPR